MRIAEKNRKIHNVLTSESQRMCWRKAEKSMNALGKNLLTKWELKKKTRRLIDEELFIFKGKIK